MQRNDFNGQTNTYDINKRYISEVEQLVNKIFRREDYGGKLGLVRITIKTKSITKKEQYTE